MEKEVQITTRAVNSTQQQGGKLHLVQGCRGRLEPATECIEEKGNASSNGGEGELRGASHVRIPLANALGAQALANGESRSCRGEERRNRTDKEKHGQPKVDG